MNRLPLPRLARRVQFSAFLFLQILIGGCASDGSSGPQDIKPPIRIAVGDTVRGTLTREEPWRDFLVAVTPGSEYAVFARSLSGNFYLAAYDSTDAFGSDAPPPLLAIVSGVAHQLPAGMFALRSERFPGSGNGTIWLRMTHLLEDTDAAFRFLVYRVNRSPEHVSGTLAMDAVIAGEDLENSADVDEYTFPVTAGEEFIGFIEALTPAPANAIGLVIPDPGNPNTVVRAGTGVPQLALESAATERIRFTASGMGMVMVERSSDVIPAPFASGASYRIQVRKINRAPEQVPALVMPGDTVTGEAIDYVGDIDEFSVAGSPGEQLTVFVQGTAPISDALLRVDQMPVSLVPSDPMLIVRDSAQPLLGSHTQRLSFDQAGTRTISVTSVESGSWPVPDRLDRGPYRLFAHAINRAPETVPATLQLGQSVTGEGIEVPGDIDEFTVMVPVDTAANLLLWRANGDVVPAFLTVNDTVGPIAAYGDPLLASGERGTGTGRFAVTARQLRVRVDGADAETSFSGVYRLETAPLNVLADGVPSLLPLGVLVPEALSPAGDEDRFSFVTEPGGVYSVGLRTLAGSTLDQVALLITDSTGAGVGIGEVVGETEANPGSDSTRLSLPQAGTYGVLVWTAARGAAGEQGPYEIIARPLSVSPEHHPSAITPDLTIPTEQLDHPGDVDEFLLTAPIGMELMVETQGLRMLMEGFDGTTYAPLRSHLVSGQPGALGRIPLLQGETVRVRISEPRSMVTGRYGTVGPYRVTFAALNRQPEAVPPTLLPGDRVAGEIISPIGDIDEYSFAGTAGQIIDVGLQAPFGFDDERLVVEIIDPAGTALVGSVATDGSLVSTGPLTLPVDGIYTFRLQGESDTQGFGQYVLVVN